MAETTIQWADYTFNPWRGCTKIAPVKQLGSNAGRKVAANDGWSPWRTEHSKGGEPHKWPDDLRIREVPCDRIPS